VSIPVDGVDTTRERGKLMLYTPMYHTDTDTAANGIEWIASGVPLTVREIRRDTGKSPIPRDGLVLSYGGLDPPPSLDSLLPGAYRVQASKAGYAMQTFDAQQLIVEVLPGQTRQGVAVSLSRGLERDRAVDESGNQIAVFGRIGSRPFHLDEMQKLYLRPDGKPWTVDTPLK